PGDGFDIDRLNHELPGDIFVLGKSEGKIGYPVMKHYTYLLGKDMIEKMDMGRLRHVAGLFSGKHDFINFAKSDKSSEKLSVRTIEVKADEINNIGGIGFIVLHFYGAGFLWQMIRRIVQCMYDYSTGKISEKRVRDFIDVKIKRNYVPAVAENLVLIDIDAGLRFNHSAKMKRQTREKMGLLEKELFFFGNLFN
ncbi:MAG: hypothetical protein U9P44_02795, partial [archaeon]|nr:hypothetical protein [archaeon]